jgi:TonB family protein
MHSLLKYPCVSALFLLSQAFAGQAADAHTASTPILIPTSCTAARDTWHAMNPDEEGHVNLRFVVRPDGTVESAEIQSESTGMRLARIARRNYIKCRFIPATREGQPAQGQTSIRLSFGAADVLTGPGNSRCETPSLPTADLRQESLGTTSMQVVFADDGRVTEVTLLSSSGASQFDEAAMRAMRTCRRSPAQAALDGNRFTYSVRWAP